MVISGPGMTGYGPQNCRGQTGQRQYMVVMLHSTMRAGTKFIVRDYTGGYVKSKGVSAVLFIHSF